MSTTATEQKAALVRTPDGAILGVDWRRERGLVPGRIAARHVMPGDTLVAQGSRVVVQRVGSHDGNAVIHTLTSGGAPIVVCWPADQAVRVVAVGAFDR